MASLEVNFCGVRIKNPIIASSAEPTLNAHNMNKCIDTGVGGVIAKTMTDSPAMRELTTRSKWRFLNERHEVCRGKVPRGPSACMAAVAWPWRFQRSSCPKSRKR